MSREKMLKSISSIALLVLIYLMGHFFYAFELFPQKFVFRAKTALLELVQKKEKPDYSNLVINKHWFFPFHFAVAEYNQGKSGLTPDSSVFGDGYVVYSSAESGTINFLDAKGMVCNSVKLPDKLMVSNLSPFDAIALDDGSVVAVYVREGEQVQGHSMARIDSNGIVWRSTLSFHHNVSLGEDGNLYALTQEMVHKEDVDPVYPMLTDTVIIIDTDGNVLESIDLWDAFINSEYKSWLYKYVQERYISSPDKIIRATSPRDIFHANAVQYIGAETALNNPYLEKGDLAVTLREMNAIAILDKDSRKVKDVIVGPWNFPHDGEFTPDGMLWIFDNRWGHTRSRVIEYDIRNRTIVSQIPGDTDLWFYSLWSSMQQKLENGNVLLSVSNEGRLLVVDGNNSVVWEWVNPEQVEKEGTRYVSRIGGGRYYNRSYFQEGFLRQIEQ